MQILIKRDYYAFSVVLFASGREARKLQQQWSTGMDFYENNLSDFFTACLDGNKPYVEKMLIEAQDKYKLMEKRETMMRFNALCCVVQGARLSVDNKPADNVGRIATLQLLIREGANIHAKDVAGYSVLFHCFTDFGNLTETRKLGIELLKAGADPNMQNRFGSTVLYENALVQNYENLEILVEHGADPSIEDNDGNSPMALIGLHRRIHEIFRKAASIESNKKRQQAISTGQINICDHCGQSGFTKLCARCCVAQYCGKECQKMDWESHRKVCKEKGKGNVEVEVKQLEEEKSFHTIINFQNLATRKSNRNNENYRQRSVFKVKVQVEATSDTTKLPLLVYNRKKTVKVKIEPTDKTYEKIVQKIREDGILKTKGFFYASFGENGEFKLQADNILPPEKW